MNIFFGSIFIKKEQLEEAGIHYPIKLEYYKVINEDEFMKKNKEKYGIGIVKTEYLNNNTRVENKFIKYLSSSETKINDILTIFKENEVTPIAAEDVICDFSKKSISL